MLHRTIMKQTTAAVDYFDSGQVHHIATPAEIA
jgi:type I site-specific restriction endonuclease